MAEKRKMSAHKVGPWAMLCLLIRVQNGECIAALSRIYAVDHQTIARWNAKWGHETKYIHAAKSFALQQQHIKEAAQTLETLKRQTDRAHAIMAKLAQAPLQGLPDAVMPQDEVPAVPRKPGGIAYSRNPKSPLQKV